jgi:hypothetical protein
MNEIIPKGQNNAYCYLLPARFRPSSIAAVATAAIVAKATSAAAAILAGFGFIDFQGATTDFLAIEVLNRRCGLFLAGHFHEGKASRASGVAVFHNTGRLNRAGLAKQLLQLLTGGLESEVSNIKFC